MNGWPRGNSLQRIRIVCANWRRQRLQQARIQCLEALLRELDPRLHRDLGFDLMGRRARDPGSESSNALIQAIKTVSESYPADKA